MERVTENIIYQKASKCWECVNKSVAMFDKLLKERSDFNKADFHKARDSLRDADGFLKETIKNAKKLLGPLQAYTADDYQKWRDELLEEFQILAMSEEYEDLRSELFEDEFLRKWIDEENIEVLLKKHFQTQQSGKRKLANIKVRIILDRLDELINQAKEMNERAAKVQQT